MSPPESCRDQKPAPRLNCNYSACSILVHYAIYNYALYIQNMTMGACTQTTCVITRTCTPAEPTEPIPRKQEPVRRRSHLIPTTAQFLPRTPRSCPRSPSRQTIRKTSTHKYKRATMRKVLYCCGHWRVGKHPCIPHPSKATLSVRGQGGSGSH